MAFYQFAKTFNSDNFDYEQLKKMDFVFMRWKVSFMLTILLMDIWVALIVRGQGRAVTCHLKNELPGLVGSMDQESSQQLQMWFSEHFFARKLDGLFVTPIVSATV